MGKHFSYISSLALTYSVKRTTYILEGMKWHWISFVWIFLYLSCPFSYLPSSDFWFSEKILTKLLLIFQRQYVTCFYTQFTPPNFDTSIILNLSTFLLICFNYFFIFFYWIFFSFISIILESSSPPYNSIAGPLIALIFLFDIDLSKTHYFWTSPM